MAEKTGLEDRYVLKDNKRLRCGYTTGTCAAAAAKAAAVMLFSRKNVAEVELTTPDGTRLRLPVEEISRGGAEAVSCAEGEAAHDAASSMSEDAVCTVGAGGTETVSCAVRKDGGDDPDVTNGLLIYAEVRKSDTPGVRILGGRGIGRVTKKGLSLPVGEPAINPVPRRMIEQAVREVCEELEEPCCLAVTISAPGGEEIAKRTFNPRLGIEGGISILGTSGIVVPMSEEALIASIRLEMETKRAAGEEWLLITPGNYGEEFLRGRRGRERAGRPEKDAGSHTEKYAGSRAEPERDGWMKLNADRSMKCSNYVGETVDLAAELGFKGILFVAHIGKFVKVSGGIMNTHSRSADCRAELMAAHALRAGADAETVRRILNTVTTEEALGILNEAGLFRQTIAVMMPRIRYYLQHRCGGAIRTEAVVFSNEYGYLGETEGAAELSAHFRAKL